MTGEGIVKTADWNRVGIEGILIQSKGFSGIFAADLLQTATEGHDIPNAHHLGGPAGDGIDAEIEDAGRDLPAPGPLPHAVLIAEAQARSLLVGMGAGPVPVRGQRDQAQEDCLGVAITNQVGARNALGKVAEPRPPMSRPIGVGPA